MSRDSNSIRNLPPGKLQDLKKLFEAGDSVPAGGTFFGTQKPALLPRPTVETQPRPAPRQLPLSKTVPPLQSENGSIVSEQEQGTDSISTSVFPSRQLQPGNKGDWFSSIDRKSVLKASKPLSPTVQRRVTQFGDAAASDGDKRVKPSAFVGHAEVHHRLVSAGAHAGSAKRRSDPGSDQDSGKELNGSRRPTGERRRTVDNVDLGAQSSRDTKEVKVTEMLKTFEKKVSSSEKPSVPKKPTNVGISRNTCSAQDISSKPPVTDENYETPWDSGKIIEQLKEMCRGGAAHVGPSEAIVVGRDRQSLAAGSVPAASPPKHGRPIGRPTEQPPPPPSKPPRTFVHEKYIKNVGNSPQEAPTTQEKKKVTILLDEEKESYNRTGKEKISVCTGEDQEKIVVDDQYTHLNKASEICSSETVGIREHPPARPPPPRPRPLSELPPDRYLYKMAGENDSDNEGPVVISLKQGKKLSRHKSITGHRDPNDQLPEPPEGPENIQRFPLRKSFSSECLNKGSLSSLSEGMGEDVSQNNSMMRSYHADDTADTPLYAAVIDPEGYAVPHHFLRIEHSAAKELSGSGNWRAFQKFAPASQFLSLTVTNTAKPVTTPVKDQDIKKVPQKKMNLVQRKINQAYETLQLHTRAEPDQEGPDQFTVADEKDSDSDSIVDASEIKRRVTYCSTIRLKTHQASLKAKQYLDMIYPQLFEYALIVGLCPKTDDPGYEPYIIHKFPQTVNSNVSVPKFCFPDADDFRPGTAVSVSESYSFVLTNIDGGRVYGYCRRMQPRDASLPEVICIISPVDAFNMYNKLLKEIESRRLKSMDNAQEVIAASFGRPLPKPGKICHIRCLDENGDMETLFLERPLDSQLEQVNYESLLCYLGTEKLIKVFSSMLMERRLILCSNHLSVLTQTIHAVVALLYPFSWQHVFIPILPPDMIEVCAAPTPFIVGILQTHLSHALNLALEDVIIVDLDKRVVLRCVGDEMTIIPKKVLRALKTAINMCKIDSDAEKSQWLMVKEAFLRMFVEVIGHFGQHIITQQDGTKALLRDQFIAGVQSKSIRQFLEWFTETQMFDSFITMHLERQEWATMDLFMTRLKDRQEHQMDSSRYRGLGQKVKNIGKAIKTKLVT